MPSKRFLRVGLMAAMRSTVSHRRIATAQRVRDLHYPNWSLHVVDGHALGLEHLRQLRVDGVIAEGGSLKGPPDPGLPLVQYGSRHQPGFP